MADADEAAERVFDHLVVLVGAEKKIGLTPRRKVRREERAGANLGGTNAEAVILFTLWDNHSFTSRNGIPSVIQYASRY